MKKASIIVLSIFILLGFGIGIINYKNQSANENLIVKIGDSSRNEVVKVSFAIVKEDRFIRANRFKVKSSDSQVVIDKENVVVNESYNKEYPITETLKTNSYEKEIAALKNYRVAEICKLTPLDEETAEIVIELADEYELNPSFLLGVMDLESSFNQYLVGTSQDRGYMQVIPSTEKWLAKAYGDELGLIYNPSEIFDPRYNISLSAKYFDVLNTEFNGNYTKMLTAYNRGTGGLYKWYKENSTYETAYSRVVLKREKKYLSVN